MDSNLTISDLYALRLKTNFNNKNVPVTTYDIYRNLPADCKVTIVNGLIHEIYNCELLYGVIVYSGFYYFLHDTIYYIVADLVGSEHFAMGVLWYSKIKRFAQNERNKQYPLAYMLAYTYCNNITTKPQTDKLIRILQVVREYYSL